MLRHKLETIHKRDILELALDASHYIHLELDKHSPFHITSSGQEGQNGLDVKIKVLSNDFLVEDVNLHQAFDDGFVLKKELEMMDEVSRFEYVDYLVSNYERLYYDQEREVDFIRAVGKEALEKAKTKLIWKENNEFCQKIENLLVQASYRIADFIEKFQVPQYDLVELKKE